MKASERQQFSIKCQCIVTRNNLQINGKRKSKFSLLTLNTLKKTLSIMPFGSQRIEDEIVFPISKMKSVLKKYIEEGKITIQFIERMERLQLKGNDMSALEEKVEIISTILISSASKENLELLISKLIEIKKGDAKSQIKQPITESKHAIKKKPQQSQNLKEEMKSQYFNRKELKQLAMNPRPKISDKIVELPKSKLNLMDLPTAILDSIFEYCQFQLRYRVINKSFSQYIIKNIKSIKVGDEIDQRSFNKLCKWAINVEGRLKNVKSIVLMDKFQNQELIKGRAKTLKFGEWKEITARNANQLKGLRIFCLQIPYQIKFQLSHLFGIRMVQLRLKHNSISNINSKNDLVRSQDIAHILKSIKDLKVLELAYCNTNLFPLIQYPNRLESLLIYSLSDNLKDVQQWNNFNKFQHLKSLSIWYLDKSGSKKENHQISITLPQSLKQLQIGSFASQSTIQCLPTELTYLKLIGQGYYNRHMEKMILPHLKLLDIALSKNIRQQALQYMENISVVTSWDRQTIDYLKNFVYDRNIQLSTTN